MSSRIARVTRESTAWPWLVGAVLPAVLYTQPHMTSLRHGPHSSCAHMHKSSVKPAVRNTGSRAVASCHLATQHTTLGDRRGLHSQISSATDC